MRLFIAIKVPEEISRRLNHIQNKLAQSGADINWVSPDNIHLTLKFIGQADQTKLPLITAVMQEAAADKNVFTARLANLGVFPEISCPRIIWAGIDKGGQELAGLASRLENRLYVIGIPKENRGFCSHITIGRVRSLLNKDALAQTLRRCSISISGKPLEFTVYKFSLFKSTLTPRGPVYELIKETSLKTA